MNPRCSLCYSIGKSYNVVLYLNIKHFDSYNLNIFILEYLMALLYIIHLHYYTKSTNL